ncbi:MAG: Asp-tRNA(Asn)/Glu-tRNA(Gln) amidotransferase subunit GatB [Candidatus Shapirobacteria bacterium]|nr:Asp-tRNA(Asn)/Glu-tRNA(Gln) amidotransferase subunit GatB [Candidatus Shapirobacteria bacterium]
MSFNVFIGLEIHIELKTNSKMFCNCANDCFEAEPNTHTCPVCLGLPGALPVVNQKAIEEVILTGLALGCQIPLFSKFDRKNYFYPDLPKGYQISQFDLPLCQKGNFQEIKIRRVHLEEDTAKLFHETINNEKVSLIDFNRSGVPLMEIVTEPDLRSAVQAKEFLKKLQQLVRFLKVADADMEKGQMRCEPTVNLEIENNGRKFYTPLVEVKNINSFRFVEKAIEYEIKRQLEEFEKTGVEKQAGNKTTRGWDNKNQKTVLQREKEEASDYRYFPEPDLPPMRFTQEQIEIIKKSMPELPEEKTKKLMKDYHLTSQQVKDLIGDEQKMAYFEKALPVLIKEKIDFPQAVNLIINKRIDITKTEPEDLAQAIKSKDKTPQLPQEELEKMVKEVISNNPEIVAQFKKGKVTVIEVLVGQMMGKTKGQANAAQIRGMLREKMI